MSIGFIGVGDRFGRGAYKNEVPIIEEFTHKASGRDLFIHKDLSSGTYVLSDLETGSLIVQANTLDLVNKEFESIETTFNSFILDKTKISEMTRKFKDLPSKTNYKQTKLDLTKMFKRYFDEDINKFINIGFDIVAFDDFIKKKYSYTEGSLKDFLREEISENASDLISKLIDFTWVNC